MIRLINVSRRYVQDDHERSVLRNVNLDVHSACIVGIRGSSGSGKTTLARILAGLDSHFTGLRVLSPGVTPQRIQLVFQDSLQAFNPRLPLGLSMKEALVAGGRARWFGPSRRSADAILETALTEVGLDPHHLGRSPGRLSGGQRQRAAIARALLIDPAVLVLDEPVASLDLSIQARILNVLQRVQMSHGISMILISHDLNVLEHMCETVYIMEEGSLWSV